MVRCIGGTALYRCDGESARIVCMAAQSSCMRGVHVKRGSLASVECAVGPNYMCILFIAYC